MYKLNLYDILKQIHICKSFMEGDLFDESARLESNESIMLY